MEFKIGEPERGRTIFEGIVDSYPKRLDLWWIYIDQEIRLKNVLGVRALFDRVLMTKLSSSKYLLIEKSAFEQGWFRLSILAEKTKSVFKKWLAFEKQHGDEVAAEAVKERAVSWIKPKKNINMFDTEQLADFYLWFDQIEYVQSLQKDDEDDE